MEWLGLYERSDYPHRQAFCPICGYVLLERDFKLGRYHDDDDDYNDREKSSPAIDLRRLPDWLKDLVYITIDPEKGGNYHIYNACKRYCPRGILKRSAFIS